MRLVAFDVKGRNIEIALFIYHRSLTLHPLNKRKVEKTKHPRQTH
jgi:hypothetical protein